MTESVSQIPASSAKTVVLITVLAVLAVIIIGGAIWHFRAAEGASSETELVDRYLEVLAKSDEKTLRKLVPETHEADAEINSRLHSFGGGSFRNISVSFSGDIPNYKVATVTGQLVDRGGREQKYQETLNLQRIDKRWFLIMGQYKGPLRIPGPGLTAPAQ